MTEIRIEVDGIRSASEKLVDDAEGIEEAGKSTVEKLAGDAENAMKRHAPEGTGWPSEHLRDTIKATKKKGGQKAVIKPHKKTRDGWLLHKAIVGNPSTPNYGDLPPPIDPLREWAGAKLGDPSVGWKLQHSIQEDGQESYPFPFIDYSVKDWEHLIKPTLQSEVRDRL